jgi:phage-related protein
MDALINALEDDPEKHAPALDAGWRPVVLRDKRGTRLRGVYAQTIICSAVMIHPEYIAL